MRVVNTKYIHSRVNIEQQKVFTQHLTQNCFILNDIIGTSLLLSLMGLSRSDINGEVTILPDLASHSLNNIR